MSERFIKRTAVVVATVVLVAVIFSVFYTALETKHECTGEDCPVCAFLLQCDSLIRTVSSGLTGVICICIAVLYLSDTVLPILLEISADTLVTKKVRLND
ncbi:MAG: hypothetical protein K6G03_05765 [Lachnospiraceae bacterium]|nr:hypothetical protein [Lachnospiraceae bacterium]